MAVSSDGEQDDFGVLGAQGVYARIFGDDGRPLGREFRTYIDRAGDQVLPHVAALRDGGFALAWSSGGPDARGDDDPYLDGWARVFDADGTPRGRDFQITPFAPRSGAEDNRIEALETLADGSVVAVTAASSVSTDREVAAARPDGEGRQVGRRAIVEASIDAGLSNIFVSTVRQGRRCAVRRGGRRPVRLRAGRRPRPDPRLRAGRG